MQKELNLVLKFLRKISISHKKSCTQFFIDNKKERYIYFLIVSCLTFVSSFEETSKVPRKEKKH